MKDIYVKNKQGHSSRGKIPGEKEARHMLDRDVHGHETLNAYSLPNQQNHFECEDREPNLAIQPVIPIFVSKGQQSPNAC